MLKSIGSNWMLNLLQIPILMVLTPFVINTLGKTDYGVWLTIASLTGILRLFILGVPMASVRFIAEHAARSDHARTNQAIATCLGITLLLGAAALVIGLALLGVFEWGYLRSAEWSGLPPTTVAVARLAFLLAVLEISAGFFMRLPYGILEAHHDFVTRNLVMGGGLLLRLVLTLALLSWRASLVLLATVLVAVLVFEFVASWWAVRRRYPHLHFGIGAFDREQLGEILAFGIFAMLLNVGTMLAFRADALVIGRWLDPQAVTDFDIGNKFFDPLTQFVISIGAVVMPMATRLRAQRSTGELRNMLLKWSKIAFSLVLCVGIYLLIAGPAFLAAWIGPEYAPISGRVLQILMVSFLLYLPVRGVGLSMLLGLGSPAKPALALLVMGVVNVGLSIFLLERYGILGVAFGTALPNVLFAATVLLLVCREIGASTRDYLRYVVARPALGAVVPAAALLGWRATIGLDGWISVLCAGVAMVGVFLFVWTVFVYRNDPFVDTSRLTGALRRRYTGVG